MVSVPGMPDLVSEGTESSRAVVSAPFRTYRHDLSFSQFSAWASQNMEKELRLVADFAYMRIGPHCISASPTARHFQVAALECTVFTLLLYLTVSWRSAPISS